MNQLEIILKEYREDKRPFPTYAELAAIASPPLVAVTDNWQPIETAPKDNTEIILYRGPDTYEGKPVAARVTCGAWIEWEERASEYHSTTGEYLGTSLQDCGATWSSWDGGFREEAPPTHWMPLPTAPGQPYANSVQLNSTQVSPQATVEPLTDEQIDMLVHQHFFGGASVAMRKFARALLAATPTASKADTVDRNAVLEEAAQQFDWPSEEWAANRIRAMKSATPSTIKAATHNFGQMTTAAPIKAEPTGEQL